MGWDPRIAVEQYDDLVLVEEPLPDSTGGGLYVRFGDGTAAIALDPRLIGPQRIEALTHELIHHERGGVGGYRIPQWQTIRQREELFVDREVARRLVPLDRLAEFCDRMADLGCGVGPDDVIHEFEVTRRVAEFALENLSRHERPRR